MRTVFNTVLAFAASALRSQEHCCSIRRPWDRRTSPRLPTSVPLLPFLAAQAIATVKTW